MSKKISISRSKDSVSSYFAYIRVNKLQLSHTVMWVFSAPVIWYLNWLDFNSQWKRRIPISPDEVLYNQFSWSTTCGIDEIEALVFPTLVCTYKPATSTKESREERGGQKNNSQINNSSLPSCPSSYARSHRSGRTVANIRLRKFFIYSKIGLRTSTNCSDGTWYIDLDLMSLFRTEIVSVFDYY